MSKARDNASGAEDRPGTAVALSYDGDGAPRVTAKGHGETARRIVDIARAHRVPTRSDDDLAAFLARVPLGDEIPRELYLAVAQVLVFAYEVSGKRVPPRVERA